MTKPNSDPMSSYRRFTRSNRRGFSSLAVIGAIALIGIVTIVYALVTQQNAPSPPDSASGTEVATSDSQRPTPESLPRSQPVSITIPGIKVTSDLLALGKDTAGMIEVPSGADYDKAAWYNVSPTPGQIGPAIIEGHIDSVERGQSVFFRLGDMRPGDMVSVMREDGRTAKFEVDGVKEYLKDEFPTDRVYGPIGQAELRLISCGGSFNPQDGRYDSNIIVFATLSNG